jgi:hypothetical protein
VAERKEALADVFTRRALRYLGFFALLLLGVRSPLPAAAAGLNLGEQLEKTVESFDKPNPHFDLACTECHAARPVFGTDTAASVTFVNGEGGNVDLCEKCHDPMDNIHPVNVDPAKAVPPVATPPLLPLETRGAHVGRVVCSSCHFIHAKTAGLKLLRGFPERSDPAEIARAPFKDRRDLCKACHGADLARKTPHKGKAGGTRTCSFCHSVQPVEGRPVELSKRLTEICDFCHAATKGAHYLMVNPFADPNLKAEIAASTLPRQDGAYTCISCHNPHGGTGESKLLRHEFVELTLKSGRIRPHYLVSLCRSCHTVMPRLPRGFPGAQPLAEIPLREANPTRLCNRCHESGLSKANAHPLRAVPDRIKERMPADWPLFEGALTCITCHTAGDSPFFDAANPNFLRGGPYENRNDICWKCHLREELSRLNPHEDVQSGRGCELCHDTKPDRSRPIDVKKLKFKGDIVVLCLRCHEYQNHPANFNHNGLPDEAVMQRANIHIAEDFPLDAEGKLTCSTCHNPHAGDPKSSRSVAVGLEICGNCHKW